MSSVFGCRLRRYGTSTDPDEQEDGDGREYGIDLHAGGSDFKYAIHRPEFVNDAMRAMTGIFAARFTTPLAIQHELVLVPARSKR